jgi:hypothetical protein
MVLRRGLEECTMEQNKTGDGLLAGRLGADATAPVLIEHSSYSTTSLDIILENSTYSVSLIECTTMNSTHYEKPCEASS